MRALRLTACVVTLAVVLGCSAGSDHEVSGSVTLRGRPLPAGHIQFEPDGAAGNSGPATSANIVNGHYRTPSGRGVSKGPYVVRILPPTGDEGDKPGPDAVFKAFVTRLEMPGKATTLDFEVAPEK